MGCDGRRGSWLLPNKFINSIGKKLGTHVVGWLVAAAAAAAGRPLKASSDADGERNRERESEKEFWK